MSMDHSGSYYLGFIAASLRPELARIVAECFLSVGNWSSVKERILSSNALQCRSATSSARLERELRHRISTLTREQVTLLAHASVEDRTAIAWLAACKYSSFLFDLTAEMLRDKLEAHDPVLRPSDYESFVESKAALHPELGRLTEISRSKIRRVVRRMLAEAGLLTPGNGLGNIHRPVLSSPVLESIVADSPSWLAGFLVPDAEIRTL